MTPSNPEPRRRSELKRSTPLKSSGFLKRTEPLPKVNRKRKAKLTLRNFGTPAFREWTKRQPCAICGEAPRRWFQRDDRWGSDCAHVEGRKMGGCGGDWTKVIPACPPCHDANKPTGEYALAREHQRRWIAEQSVT